ncbi:MAG: hypothetical protein NTY83_02560 [Candidatus Micrarchaeota archaeon]|nr:hypothetical protein [Candidatus Micrarchaeota archaeon]
MGGPAEAAPLETEEKGGAAITLDEFRHALNGIALGGDAQELIYLWKNAPEEHRGEIEAAIIECLRNAKTLPCSEETIMRETRTDADGEKVPLPYGIIVEAAARMARRGFMVPAARMLTGGEADEFSSAELERAIHEGILFCKSPGKRGVECLAELMEVENLPQTLCKDAKHAFYRVLKMMPHPMREGKVEWKETFHDHLLEMRLTNVLGMRLPDAIIADVLGICGELGKVDSVYAFSRCEGLSPCLAKASKSALIGAIAVCGRDAHAKHLAEIIKTWKLDEDEMANARWAFREALRIIAENGACAGIAELYERRLVPEGVEAIVDRALAESIRVCRDEIDGKKCGCKFARSAAESLLRLNIPEWAKSSAMEMVAAAQKKDEGGFTIPDKAREFIGRERRYRVQRDSEPPSRPTEARRYRGSELDLGRTKF